MIFRSWGRRVLVLVSVSAAVSMCGASGCGGDDQPAAGGGPGDEGGLADVSSGDGGGGDGGGDGSSGDARADSTVDGSSQDVVISDVRTEVVLEDTSNGDAPIKDTADEFMLPDGGCGPKTGYSNNGDGGASTCGVGQTYACQGGNYQIDCECPSGLCMCTRNGTMVGPSMLYAGCNACTAPDFAFLALNCGVPY